MKKLFIILSSIFSFVSISRADTTTSNIGLTIPTIGTSGWATKLNSNFSIIDSSAIFKAQTTTISADTTWTGQRYISSGTIITVPTGVTLSIRGDIQAGAYKIFALQGTGRVQFLYFGNTNTATVLPEWWGATGDGSTDDVTAINNSIDAFQSGWGKVAFTGKSYAVASTITVNNSHILLEGTIPTWRPVPPQIVSLSTSSAILMITGTTAGGDADGSNDGPQVNNLSFTRSVGGGLNSKSIIVQNAVHAGFYNDSWGGSQYGMYVKNVGGLYLDKCNAYPGTDNNGSVYGIYLDGTTQNNVGVAIHEYGYSSNAETDIVYAYYDNNTGGTAKGAGDRILSDVICSGEIDYGIYIVDNSGFSSDVIIRNISFDNIQVAGITLRSPNPVYFQQANIQTGWLNLAAANAVGIDVIGRQNTNVSNMTIAASLTTQTGIKYEGSNYGTISNNNFTGSTYFTNTILLTSSGTNKSNANSITNNTSVVAGAIGLVSVSSSVIVGNVLTISSITLDSGSNDNDIAHNKVWAVLDSGTGNGVLSVDTVGRLVYYGDVIAGHTGLAIAGTSGQITASAGAGGVTMSLVADTTISSSTQGNFVNFPTTGNFGDLLAVNLTDGVWDVTAMVDERGSTPTNLEIGLSTTAGNSTAGLSYGITRFGMTSASTTSDNSASIPRARITISGNQTLYLKYEAAYGGSPTISGNVIATRVANQ